MQLTPHQTRLHAFAGSAPPFSDPTQISPNKCTCAACERVKSGAMGVTRYRGARTCSPPAVHSRRHPRKMLTRGRPHERIARTTRRSGHDCQLGSAGCPSLQSPTKRMNFVALEWAASCVELHEIFRNECRRHVASAARTGKTRWCPHGDPASSPGAVSCG